MKKFVIEANIDGGVLDKITFSCDPEPSKLLDEIIKAVEEKTGLSVVPISLENVDEDRVLRFFKEKDLLRVARKERIPLVLVYDIYEPDKEGTVGNFSLYLPAGGSLLGSNPDADDYFVFQETEVDEIEFLKEALS